MEPKQTSTNIASPRIGGQPKPFNDVTPFESRPPAPSPVSSSPPPAPLYSSSVSSFVPAAPAATSRKRLRIPLWLVATGASLAIAVGGILFFVRQANQTTAIQANSFDSVQIPFDQLDAIAAGSVKTMAVNGQLLVNDSLVIAPSTQPSTAVAGQLYYNQANNQLAYYNGTEFVGLLGGTATTTLQNNTTTINTASTITITNPSTSSGTTGRIAKFTGVENLGDSIMSDTGSAIRVEGNVNLIDPPSNVPEISIWPTNPTPAVENQPDAHAPPDVELGVKFRSDVDGVITGIRFYKGTSNTGTHTGSLWTAGGTLLGTATFTSETASGWQEVRFGSPIAISADTTYIASYHTSAGFYSITDAYFTSSVDNSPLHALQDGTDGPNGVFRYSLTPAFPNQTFNRTNYWVDVLFKPGTNIAKYQVNGAQISSADLVNNADLAKRSASQIFTGSNTFKKTTNATTAFSIQNAAGTDLFSVDSVNSRLYIGPQGGGSGAVVLVLSTKTNAGDPDGIEGGMYYSDTLKTYRCYRDGAWTDCADINPDRGFSLYDEFMGGENTNGTIGSLGWNVHDIGGASTITLNPTTPTAVADRPGVLAVATPAIASQGTTLALAKSNNASMVIGAGHTMKTAVAVGSTTNQVLRVGLHSQTTTSTQPVSGVWWEADPAADTNWRYCHGNGTTATCASSGIVITANSWVRLEIRVTATGTNSSAASFVINGAAINVSGVTIDTTNRVSPALSCYTTTGTSKECYWDYFQVRGAVSVSTGR